MWFDCPPATFKPRISHDGWSTPTQGHLWSVTEPSGDFHLFDTLGQAAAFIREEYAA